MATVLRLSNERSGVLPLPMWSVADLHFMNRPIAASSFPGSVLCPHAAPLRSRKVSKNASEFHVNRCSDAAQLAEKIAKKKAAAEAAGQ